MGKYLLFLGLAYLLFRKPRKRGMPPGPPPKVRYRRTPAPRTMRRRPYNVTAPSPLRKRDRGTFYSPGAQNNQHKTQKTRENTRPQAPKGNFFDAGGNNSGGGTGGSFGGGGSRGGGAGRK